MKTLLTQQYLRSGKTLQNLFQRFDVQHNICDPLGVVVFNYRVLSPLEEPLVRETRGLILELGTWNVVCKSLDAFFEPDNPRGKDIMEAFDWNSAYAVPKYDGALVTLYHYKDAWHIGTRFVADGSWVVYTPNSNTNEITWRELFEQTLLDMGTSFEEFTAALDPRICYTFEQCSPENRVVCIYDSRRLWLVGAVNLDTLEEVDVFTLEPFVSQFADFLPERISVGSLDDCHALLREFYDPLDYEGFVAVDSSFRRLKIRNPRYTALMRSHSMDDELNMLRELRSVFLMNSTIDTGPVTTSSSTTGTTGGVTEKPPQTEQPRPGGISTEEPQLEGISAEQPRRLGGMSASQARIQPAPQSMLRSVINRILYLAKWISENYDQIKELSPEEREGHPAMVVWPEAIALMDQGYAVSDILGKTTEEDQIAALERFEREVGGR
jgi:hypothetical protein